MNSDKKTIEEILKEDITEIIIERIQKKNAEFVNLNRIFLQQSRRIKAELENPDNEIERAL
jgi:hypothetical protein